MTPKNRLGIFVRVPVAGHVKTRLVPPLSAETACDLYRAFLGDLFERLGGVKAVVSVFYSGEPAETMQPLLPRPWPLVAQSGSTLGERMAAAFNHLLAGGASRAVVIGS
ncbi:MAG TPA: DUF2064 domain-containing protein, partial [Candidatus Krumholzibacteria bacterium]|nr:DUF2064 domain-containing protein [Candidatus Krumholzibacteria bacterium]